jgi:hypothetical protein
VWIVAVPHERVLDEALQVSAGLDGPDLGNTHSHAAFAYNFDPN